MKRGDVCWYTFQTPEKRRPVLVLTRTSAQTFLSGITVAPLTTTIRDIPTAVVLTPEEDGVPSLCAVNLDNLQTVQRSGLRRRITSLSPQRMDDVNAALRFALGIN